MNSTFTASNEKHDTALFGAVQHTSIGQHRYVAMRGLAYSIKSMA